MAKFKSCNEDQLVMLPISLQDQLVPPGTLEHTLSKVADKYMDFSVFDARYHNDQTGGAAIPPTVPLSRPTRWMP